MPLDDDVTVDDSIDDTLAATLKEINARGEEPAVVDEPAETPAEEVAAEPKDDRVRDEKGRFAPKEAAEPETPAEPTEPAPVDPLARDLNRPPSSWKPAAKAAWESLPPDIRAEVHRRESDFLKGQSGLIEKAKRADTFDQVISPYRMIIEAEGGTPEGAVADLLKTAALLRMGTPQQKRDLLLRTAQQFNIDLAVPEGEAPQVQQQPLYDPRVDTLLRQQQQHQEEQQRQLAAAAQAWMDEQADGRPVRPFVENVWTEMTSKLAGIRATNPGWTPAQILTEAYDRACWENPEVRSTLLAQREAEAKRKADETRRVDSARKAQAVNVPSRPSLPTAAPVGSIDDTLRETYRALTS